MRAQVYCATVVLTLLVVFPANSLEPTKDDVFVRIADVGAGLCCVIALPDADNDTNQEYLIYDAGNYIGLGAQSFAKIAEIIPEGATIRLMVLSHSDADHLGAVDEICDVYKVQRIWRTGLQRTTATWRNANDAIKQEIMLDKCVDINLRKVEFPVGATYRFGEVFVTMVTGFHEPPKHWNIKDQSERRNANSICIRLQFKKKAILFCGDAVGRHIGDPDNVCIATEKFMVEMSEVLPIKSDVIIAPHHGADNGSSTKFIKAVSPQYVIFSAGHKHHHPRAAAAKRYLDCGVDVAKIFRTDRGDNEGSTEWNIGGGTKKDSRGDDDVDIIIRNDGKVEVAYRAKDECGCRRRFSPFDTRWMRNGMADGRAALGWPLCCIISTR